MPLSEEQIRKQEQKPWLVYLQGGPGFGCAPPQSMDLTKFALDHGYQMLYLDQRGTGLSTTITTATLALQGDARKQAEYLKLFRADNIVRDCEAIRETLTTGYPPELKKWSIFGQSFGGFCAFTYLSKYPQGLREAFTTGGVPPVGKTVDEIYSHTYETVSRRNALYYEKFPEDQGRVHNIVSFIRSQGSILLPSGGIVFQSTARLISWDLASLTLVQANLPFRDFSPLDSFSASTEAWILYTTSCCV